MADDKPIILVENTVNGVPSAMPSRKVMAGGIYGVLTALAIILLKRVFPEFELYLDDPTVVAAITDTLTQAAPVIVGFVVSYFTKNAKA